MRRLVMALAVAAATLMPAAPAVAAPADFTATEVSFTSNDGVVLHGTVLAPASGGAARRPGIVMLEGAGNRGRSYLRPEAEAYARHGVVTLIYDKRTEGYSAVHRDFSLLADDALAGLRLLRDRPDVDPSHLGLWALSEGAWVAPLAANRSADVRFLITVGAVGITPAAQTAWAYGTYLRHAGVSGSLPRTMRGTVVQTTIDLGIFAESDFDALPAWQQVRQPVLNQWGQLDRDALPGLSSRLIGGALDRGGNTSHTIRIVDGTNHNLHRTAADGFDRLPDLPADYADFETAWIADPSLTAPSASLADEPAPPVFAAGDHAWVSSGVVLALLVAFAGFLVVGRRSKLGRPARWLAVLTPVTLVATYLYLMFLLVVAAKVTGPVVLGRPLPWLLLQLLALATVAATVAVAATWRHHLDLTTPGRIRLALLTATGALFAVWAVQWGLLLP
ncbi:alpha/beta hydrolase family protein [Dactylosporangium cerinum]|uniref:Alpha/beta hydrolase family protein n=1 Tax=Dactylosporangium cerinum TaxID=1434730 RepID=A0ABV9VX04_9ACTN